MIAVCRTVAAVIQRIAQRMQYHQPRAPREQQRGCRGKQGTSGRVRCRNRILSGKASDAPRQEVGALEPDGGRKWIATGPAQLQDGRGEWKREMLCDFVVGGDFHFVFPVGS